jgi:hypothetical protein
MPTRSAKRKVGWGAKKLLARAADALPQGSLLGLPGRFAAAMQTDGWLCRSEVIWHKNRTTESGPKRPVHSHRFYVRQIDAIRVASRGHTGTQVVTEDQQRTGKPAAAYVRAQRPRLSMAHRKSAGGRRDVRLPDLARPTLASANHRCRRSRP